MANFHMMEARGLGKNNSREDSGVRSEIYLGRSKGVRSHCVNPR